MRHLSIIFFAFMVCSCDGQATTDTMDRGLYWAAAWSSDGQYLAVASDRSHLDIFHYPDMKLVKKIVRNGTTFTSLAWHPTTNQLAVLGYSHDRAAGDKLAQIYDLDQDESLFLDHPGGGRGVCWSPDGTRLAVNGDGLIRIFGVDGQLLQTIPHDAGRSLFSVDWHPTKDWIAVTEEDVRVFEVNTGKQLRRIETNPPGMGVMAVRWHPSGTWLATADYANDGPSMLKFWKDDGTLIKALKGSKAEYRGLAWSPDGEVIATASDSLRLWSKDGVLLATANKTAHPYWGVDWNKAGTMILTAGGNENVYVWTVDGTTVK
jgi:WD40 repeat protein